MGSPGVCWAEWSNNALSKLTSNSLFGSMPNNFLNPKSVYGFTYLSCFLSKSAFSKVTSLSFLSSSMMVCFWFTM